MKFVLGVAMAAALCGAAAAQDVVAPAPEAVPPQTPAPEATAAAPEAAPEAPPITAAAAPETPPAAESSVPAGHGLAPKNSVVVIQVAEPLSSKTAKIGDKFAIKLAQPIVTSEGLLVPAGTPGVGEVVSASKAGAMGKAGELVLAARYLDFNGQQIPLKTFKLGVAGKNNSTALGVAMFAAPLPIAIALLAVPGGNIDVPAGALANAKLAADVSLPLQPLPAEPATPVEAAIPVQPAS